MRDLLAVQNVGIINQILSIENIFSKEVFIMGKVKKFSFNAHVLSEWEIINKKQEGLIFSDIDGLSRRIIEVYPASDNTWKPGGPLSEQYFKSLGIKESFFLQTGERLQNAIAFDSIHFTDFYLIHCSYYLGRNYAEPKLTYIPLEYVEICELKLAHNSSGYIPPSFKTVQKNPVKGAVIGGIVAGRTGAVIGAAASSGTKTVVKNWGGLYDNNEYSLVVKIEGEEEQIYESFLKCPNNVENNAKVDQKNRNARRLIERAKSLNSNEKMRIVKELNEERKKNWRMAGRCQYCGGLITGVFKRKCAVCGQAKDY